MEFDNNTQVSTEDFANFLSSQERKEIQQYDNAVSDIFANGGGFADEEGFKAPQNAVDDASEYFEYSGTDAGDIAADVITEALNEEGEDIDPLDFVDANELPEYVAVNGEKVEREVIEKALNAYGGFKEWGNNLNTHFDELDALEANIDKMYQLSNSEINMYIEQLEDVVDNDRLDSVKRIEALKQLKAYQAQKANIEKAYSENFASVQARKAHAEQLKGQAVSNELVAMGWKQPDFETTANFMIKNDIRLAAKDVSSSLMIALKKAALYDADKNKLKEETKSNVQKAITGTPQRKTKTVAPEDSRKKAMAKKLAEEGKLNHEAMFDYLIN